MKPTQTRRWKTVGTAAVLVCAVLSVTPARSGDVSIRASISPTTVPLGNEAVLTVVVEGKFRRSVSPELPDIQDLYMSESGTSQSFSFINGQVSSSITFTYAVSPQKEGSYTISPITFTLDNEQYTADPVTLEVTAATSSVSPPAQAPTQPLPGQTSPPPTAGAGGDHSVGDESIFITATTDHDTVYVNQQVTWTLGYYTDGRVSLLRSPNYSPPSAEGFWVEDLPPQNKYYATLHNRQYLVNEIKRAYFPTAPGVYTIGAARVDMVIDDASRARNLDDFFNRSMFSRGFGESKTLMTDERKVVVLPLPDGGRPTDFGGIVARDLRVSIAADKQVVQVGEPVNVTIEVNGVGNIKTITPPELEKLDKYKVYESGTKSDTFKKDYVVSGRRRYDFVVIPQVEGRWSIPAVEMSYFDPVAKSYQVARSHVVTLDVKPGAKEEGRKVIYAGGGDDIEVINRDIRYIHPVPSSLALEARPLYKNKIYLGLHALPLLAVVGSLFVERRRRRYREDVVFARSSRALRDANRKLSRGEALFSGGDVEGGYAALSSAVIGYVADKMNAPPAGLTADSVEVFLRERGVDDETVGSTRGVLAECDAARFAAGVVSAERGRASVARARESLHTIERKLRS